MPSSGVPVTGRRKLIEVSLPLAAITAAAEREKRIKNGHPAMLHLWWARRPLATCRAVLFAQLVDDPSSRPREFPAVADQERERARLHDLIGRLAMWENAADDDLLALARAEIVKSCDGDVPPVLDPFAGGGSIPLEAQRLGLEPRACDLNPVAVLINQALVGIPSLFAGRAPVHPSSAEPAEPAEPAQAAQPAQPAHPNQSGRPGQPAQPRDGAWPGTTGLASDVRHYGRWLRDEAERRIGQHYPQAALPGGGQATVIAWIWARTVACPDPDCAAAVPLVHSWWLSRKKGKEAFVKAEIKRGRVHLRIRHGRSHAPATDGTISQGNAHCLVCGGGVPKAYIKAEGMTGRIGATLLATAAQGQRERIYLDPSPGQVQSALVPAPAGVPDQRIGDDPRTLGTPRYGLDTFAGLFTNRQLLTMTTLTGLITQVRDRVLDDATAAGRDPGRRLADGGRDAHAYADAVATYLALVVSKLADQGNALCRWDSVALCPRPLFNKQAIPMVWDFAEANPFSTSSGSLDNLLRGLDQVLQSPAFPDGSGHAGSAVQWDAGNLAAAGAVMCTDPPYYDTIGYSDLADFFYVWLQRSLRSIHPDLTHGYVTPKRSELVANAQRQDGWDDACAAFGQGLRRVFRQLREGVSAAAPSTVFYPWKDLADPGGSPDGWETLLGVLIGERWTVTAIWPVRTAEAPIAKAPATGALAPAVVLAIRPRPDDAGSISWSEFASRLRAELPGRLGQIMRAAIGPGDLAQSALGAGLAVFTRYAAVLDDDGHPAGVREALAEITTQISEQTSDPLDERIDEHVLTGRPPTIAV